ncbi:MAG: hypothetical protein ACJ780_03845 [Solirubrobacteraceae bacterium]
MLALTTKGSISGRGRSDAIGPLATAEEHMLLPRSSDVLSESTRSLIDSETGWILDECYRRELERLR